MTTQTAIRVTNRAGLPDAIVRAIANDSYSRGESDITVTQLLNPPRLVALARTHAAEITEDAADLIWRLMGQVIHTILERADHAALAERLYVDVDGPLGTWRVGGHTDSVVVDEQADAWAISDYKLTSVWAVIYGRAEWEEQLNLYAHLFRANGFQVSSLEIVAILRDWSKLEAARSPDYPARQVVRIPVSLWPHEQAQEYLAERVRVHQLAREVLPECSPAERWAKPDRWALMKEGRKSAVKLFDDPAIAYDVLSLAGKGHNVVKRSGDSTRCRFYCQSAPFCHQWAALNETEAAE